MMREQDKTSQHSHHYLDAALACGNADATSTTSVDRRGLGGYMAAGVCPDWTDIDCVGPLLMHAAIVLAGVGREAV